MSKKAATGKSTPEAIAAHVTPADGNVFADLGFPPEEAENLKIRAELMMALERYIKERRLKQEEAAELLGVTQPRISDLVNGKIDRFSIDTLINMLAAAGLHVSISVEEQPA